MGRSKSKKTNQPSLDFKTKKKKLGKKPPPNPNITVTTFKSKTLYIPGQSLGEKEDQLTNQRNLTLKELLTKTKHYNETVRRDALHGLKDLIQSHPVIVGQHLGPIINGVVEMVNDNDKNVRAAAHSVITKVLPLVDTIMISPFLPLFSIYITSGMTHLKSSIRMDSLQLFEMLTNQYPQMIAFSRQIIPNYLELLKRVGIHSSATSTTPSSGASGAGSSSSSNNSANGSSSGNAAGSSKSSQLNQRIQILKSLHKLLEILLPREASHQKLLVHVKKSNQLTRSWISTGGNANLLNNFNNYIEKSVYFANNNSSNNSSTSSSSAPRISSRALDTSEETLEFTANLLPLLIECWLELTPSNPGSHAILVDMELIVKMLLLLINKIKDENSIANNNAQLEKIRQDYLKYFATHYPVLVGSSDNPDSKEYTISQEINAIVTQTLALLLPINLNNNNSKSTTSGTAATLPTWFDKVIDFLEDALDGKLVKEGERGQAVRTSISTYLWVVIKILPNLSQERVQSLLESFIKFDTQCHPHSTAKKSCVFFIKELVDIQDSLKDKSIKKIIEWGLSSLPKLLWRLGSSDPNTTLMIISILLSFGKDSTKKGQYDSIQNALVPFIFTISKPNEKYPQGKQVYGPFINLPLEIQIQSLYLIYYFSSISMLTIRALIAVCKSINVSIEVKERIFDITFYKYNQFGLDNYLAFCISITLAMIHQLKEEEAVEEDIDQEKDKVENEIVDLDATEQQQQTSLKRKFEKIDNNNNEKVQLKLQHIEKVLNRIFRDINHIRSSVPIKKVLTPILSSVLKEFETQSIDGKKYILQFIYSCFDDKSQEEWNSAPKNLIEGLPKLLTGFLLQVEQEEKELNYLKDNYISLVHQYLLLDNSNQLIINFFIQLSDQVKQDKTKLLTIAIIIMNLLKNKQLESTLFSENVKNQLSGLVNQIVASEILEEEKSTVDKLKSEFNILFNKI